MSNPTMNRRQLVQLVGTGLLLSSAVAKSSDMPKVDESDPTATALKYVSDASQADPAARTADDHFCSNCQFYTAPGDGWGPCALFPGKLVSEKGWCSAWVLKS